MQEIASIWLPSISFDNAKIGQLEIRDLGVMVRRESEPEDFTYTDPVEGKKSFQIKKYFVNRSESVSKEWRSKRRQKNSQIKTIKLTVREKKENNGSPKW